MAMTFQAVISGTTYELNDGNPFRLARVGGAGPSEVNRLGSRGPLQSGVTDMGYRLRPRVLELAFHFYATTDAILDARRQTLMGIFHPTAGIPIELRVTRDDGEVRKLDCHSTGAIEIGLVPEHRPGHLHQAVVRLRAADPTWKAASSTLVTFSGTTVAGTAMLGTIFPVNNGDFKTYPYVTIRGPIYNAIIRSATMGDVIDLTGITLGSADTYLVDLTSGDKSLFDINGFNKLGDMGTPVYLADWHLAPDPVASGGTNTITIQGGSTSTNTEITLLYHDHFMSF